MLVKGKPWQRLQPLLLANTSTWLAYILLLLKVLLSALLVSAAVSRTGLHASGASYTFLTVDICFLVANKHADACRLTINCEGQAAPECGGVVVNRTNPRVFLDNLEFRYTYLGSQPILA